MSGFNFGAPAQSAAPSTTGGSTFGFGFTQAPSTSFGFGSSQPATQSFGFGATGATQQTGVLGGSTSAFGAPAPASTGFGFGSAATTTTTLTPSPTGATTTSPFSFSPVGAPAPQQGTAPTPVQPSALQFLDSGALSELASVEKAYRCEATNPHYKLRGLFLNVVNDPHGKVLPPGVDQRQLREAFLSAGGVQNPDSLWPVLALGFKDLQKRAQAQETHSSEHAERLARLTGLLTRLRQRQESDVRRRIEAIQAVQARHVHSLLRAFRYLDALEGAASSGGAGGRGRSSAQAQELRDRARELEHLVGSMTQGMMSSLSGGSASYYGRGHRNEGNLLSRAEAISTLARAKARSVGKESSRLADLDGEWDDATLQQLYAAIQGQISATQKVQDVLAKDERDLAIIAEGIIKGAGY